MNPVEETESLKGLYKKLHVIKGKMGGVTKSSNNPFFKSKYADLNAHLELIEPLLAEVGLVLTQSTVANPNGNVVKTDITDTDSSAQISSTLLLPKIEDMQKLGAAITYARRFTLGSLLAMQAVDDDGETAVGRGSYIKASSTAAPVKAKSGKVQADF